MQGATKQPIAVVIILYAFLIAVAITCLLPFYSMFITSTHANSDIARRLLLIPGDQFMANYERLIDTVNIWRGFLNTVFITVTATAINLYFAALGGYGFSKYQFRFKGFLFLFVLGTMMIPGQLGIIGFYKLMDAFHMLNTYWPLILPSIYNAFGIFLMKQFADSSVPTEIIESGRIDGSGELAIFHRIVLPLMGPAMATLGIFAFIGKWNDFLNPMIILFDNELQTLPVMIASVKSQFSSDFGAQYVGIVISVVPILIFFSFMSKRIISGVAAGAVKG
ncbi:carbohydrate ABC transporter permease [Paenibacillus cisolokensis]|jgi:ABC-type sugar transport system, permease component|uniref:Sugar ABC transporter ATP-binding protein n=1 Tax=Paenibacillus cisolokensis TaxID=1658519 RepID=A0ABQ4NCY9_9BACL|nr:MULTISPECIES: carbohydrate ABC transporter permease [Paenibacillus]ALS27086.1 sugar ABC transporter permease [Paenibacillus sp. 32O-W]GIQ65838.1 sugar ABC transporter ATP-binding protein [Paenibacillus cisolokensis]